MTDHIRRQAEEYVFEHARYSDDRIHKSFYHVRYNGKFISADETHILVDRLEAKMRQEQEGK